MKTCLATLVSLCALLAGATAAQAQYSGLNPYYRPTVTPYLNLYRGGAPLWQNYYNLVRPELDTGAAIRQLQQQNFAQQQTLNDLTTPSGLPPTGIGAGFMTQGRYFFTNGGGGIGGSGVGGGGTGINSRPLQSGPTSTSAASIRR